MHFQRGVHLFTFTSADLHLLTCTSADLHLLTCTSADLHLLTCTSADLHLLTCASAGLHLLTCTSADLHLLTCTSADLDTSPSHLLIQVSHLTSADLDLLTLTSADLDLSRRHTCDHSRILAASGYTRAPSIDSLSRNHASGPVEKMRPPFPRDSTQLTFDTKGRRSRIIPRTFQTTRVGCEKKFIFHSRLLSDLPFSYLFPNNLTRHQLPRPGCSTHGPKIPAKLTIQALSFNASRMLPCHNAIPPQHSAFFSSLISFFLVFSPTTLFHGCYTVSC